MARKSSECKCKRCSQVLGTAVLAVCDDGESWCPRCFFDIKIAAEPERWQLLPVDCGRCGKTTLVSAQKPACGSCGYPSVSVTPKVAWPSTAMPSSS